MVYRQRMLQQRRIYFENSKENGLENNSVLNTDIAIAEKDEKWTKVCEVLQNIYLSCQATCPSNDHFFKSQRVNSLVNKQ